METNRKPSVRMENEELEQFAIRVADRVYSHTAMSRIRHGREIKKLTIAVGVLALGVIALAASTIAGTTKGE